MNKTVFIPDKVHKQNLPPYQHNVSSHLKHFAHCIQSSPVRSLEKQPVHYIQSASCSSSSSVASSTRGTANSFSLSGGVSAGVGFQQTFLFRLFEGQEEHSTHSLCFEFNGLSHFLFLSCLSKFFVR